MCSLKDMSLYLVRFFFKSFLPYIQQHLQFSVSWVFGLVSKYVGGSYVKGSMLNQNFVNNKYP